MADWCSGRICRGALPILSGKEETEKVVKAWEGSPGVHRKSGKLIRTCKVVANTELPDSHTVIG